MRLVAAALILSMSTTSFAQEVVCADSEGKEYTKECSDEKPGNCSIAICESSVAPFGGYLVTESLITDLMLRAKNSEDKAEAGIVLRQKLFDEKLRYQEEVHKLDLDLSARETKMWKEIAEDRKLSWYEKPTFYVVVTAVAVSALAIGLSQGIRADLVN